MRQSLSHQLSYRGMTVDARGQVISRSEKEALRLKQGLCVTCPGIPVQLYDIRKSRYNPLWQSKHPRTVPGESLNGMCCKCHPGLLSSTTSSSSTGRSDSCSSLSSVDSFQDRRCEASSAAAAEMRNRAGRARKRSLSRRRRRRRRRHHQQSAEQDRSSSKPNQRSSSSSTIRTNGSGTAGSATNLTVIEEPSLASSFDDDGSLASRSTVGSDATITSSSSSRRDSFRRSESSLTKEETDRIIADLDALIRGMRATAVSNSDEDDDMVDILIDVLVNAMASNQYDKAVQKYCLCTITDVFQNSSVCRTASVMSPGGHKCIVLAMKRFLSSGEIQKHGLFAIVALCTNEKNRVALIQERAHVYMVEAMVHHMHSTSLVSSALGTLLFLISLCLSSSGEEEETYQVLQHLTDYHNVIAGAMLHHSNSAAIQRDGCALLFSCTKGPGLDEEGGEGDATKTRQQRMAAVCQHDTLQAVVDALRLHKEDETVVASACSILRAFALEESSCRSMRLVEDIFEVLDSVVSAYSASSRQDSISYSVSQDVEQILERLSASKAQDEMMENEAYESMLALLELRSGDHNAASVVDDIMDTLGSFSWSTKIESTCWMILRALSNVSDSYKNAILEQASQRQLVDSVHEVFCSTDTTRVG